MQDRITVQNQTRKPVSLELALAFGNDFADIFAVKNYDFALGDPDKARGAAARGRGASTRKSENQFVLVDDGGFARTQIILTQRGLVEPDKVRFWIELEPRASWELGFDVVPSLDGERGGPARGAAAVRRGARPDRGLAGGLEPARAEAARVVGRPRSRVPAVGRRPRVAPAAGRGTVSGTFRPQGCRGS